jgi:hypothetical protein
MQHAFPCTPAKFDAPLQPEGAEVAKAARAILEAVAVQAAQVALVVSVVSVALVVVWAALVVSVVSVTLVAAEMSVPAADVCPLLQGVLQFHPHLSNWLPGGEVQRWLPGESG